MYTILIGCPICGGQIEHVASHERGKKKVCLDVDQSYMACYE
jgi:hypothetical protein